MPLMVARKLSAILRLLRGDMSEASKSLVEIKLFRDKLALARAMLKSADTYILQVKQDTAEPLVPKEGHIFEVSANGQPLLLQRNVRITEDSNRPTPNWVRVLESGKLPEDLVQTRGGVITHFRAALIQYSERELELVALNADYDLRLVLGDNHVIAEVEQ